MTTITKLDLITSVEHIVDLAKDSKLSSEFFSQVDCYIKYVSKKQDITDNQSVLLALFMDKYEDDHITISELAECVDCRPTRMLRYVEDLNELEKRGFIRCCKGELCITYRVPREVVDAFQKNEKYELPNISGLSCVDMFGVLENIFDMRDRDELSYSATMQRINDLFEANKHLEYVQKLKSFNLSDEDKILIVFMSHELINTRFDFVNIRELEDLFDNTRQFTIIRNAIKSASSELLKRGLIEFSIEDGLANGGTIRLTTETKNALLRELNFSLTQVKREDILKADAIVCKKLFYNDKVSKQVTELNDLLDDTKYKQIRERMKEKGFRCGFTCLFYGEPGTGKTETALQLARQTGRDILQVNLAEIKSKWVGESEKNIKLLFDNYLAYVKQCERTPILLFNEADGIISKRNEGCNSAVDKMENTIQNIILQEMETLDGILIATTNLTQNMDNAFERRFLYKIRFDKPDAHVRQNLWLTMMPTIPESDAQKLADIYDFSGGQIENISRKASINAILHGEESNTLSSLIDYCNEERIVNHSTPRKVGFV
ncbi:MAG: ATP-binding protein [Bacteroidales bacterium]|nr:ATP-binding protein [Bacteroidales bacterium]